MSFKTSINMQKLFPYSRKTPADYLERYLKIAPTSLAIWRATEAAAIDPRYISDPILDVGCGFGEFMSVYFDTPISTGIDINPGEIGLAKKSGVYKHLECADARSMPFPDSSFQTVMSISVLEHICHAEKAIAEIFRVLKPKGYFIFTVPTSAINKYMIVPPPRTYWLRSYHRIFKHEIIQNLPYWTTLCKNNGFRIVNTKGTLSDKQLCVFELLLPFSIPSQILRLIKGKRTPYTLWFKSKLLTPIFAHLIQKSSNSEINVCIIAQKI
jgi:ubiquinone/menaquinone biosynthesis C-methylase UbiE